MQELFCDQARGLNQHIDANKIKILTMTSWLKFQIKLEIHAQNSVINDQTLLLTL